MKGFVVQGQKNKHEIIKIVLVCKNGEKPEGDPYTLISSVRIQENDLTVSGNRDYSNNSIYDYSSEILESRSSLEAT